MITSYIPMFSIAWIPPALNALIIYYCPLMVKSSLLKSLCKKFQFNNIWNAQDKKLKSLRPENHTVRSILLFYVDKNSIKAFISSNVLKEVLLKKTVLTLPWLAVQNKIFRRKELASSRDDFSKINHCCGICSVQWWIFVRFHLCILIYISICLNFYFHTFQRTSYLKNLTKRAGTSDVPHDRYFFFQCPAVIYFKDISPMHLNQILSALQKSLALNLECYETKFFWDQLFLAMKLIQR